MSRYGRVVTHVFCQKLQTPLTLSVQICRMNLASLSSLHHAHFDEAIAFGLFFPSWPLLWFFSTPTAWISTCPSQLTGQLKMSIFVTGLLCSLSQVRGFKPKKKPEIGFVGQMFVPKLDWLIALQFTTVSRKRIFGSSCSLAKQQSTRETDVHVNNATKGSAAREKWSTLYTRFTGIFIFK